MRQFANWPQLIPVIILAVVLVLPVFLIRLSLGDTFFGFPYLILAIIVLFFSTWPKRHRRGLVDDYCRAVEADDDELIRSTAKALIEDDPPADPLERIRKVEEAVLCTGEQSVVRRDFLVRSPRTNWCVGRTGCRTLFAGAQFSMRRVTITNQVLRRR